MSYEIQQGRYDLLLANLRELTRQEKRPDLLDQLNTYQQTQGKLWAKAVGDQPC